MQCRFFKDDITKYWDMLPSPCGWRKKGGVTDFCKHLCFCSQERKKKRNRLSQWFSENINATEVFWLAAEMAFPVLSLLLNCLVLVT